MGLVRLTTCADGVETEMVCALLRGYGLRCASVSSGVPGTGATLGVLVGGMAAFVSGDRFGPHDVMVNEEDIELAREILAAPIQEEPTESGT
jgi:hypothetical protein